MDIQRELMQQGLTRRNRMRLGVLDAGTAMLLPIPGFSLRAAWAKGSDREDCPLPGVDIISPPTRPWLEQPSRLIEMKPISPSTMRGGAPQPTPQRPVTGVTHGDPKRKLLRDSQPFWWGLERATPYGDLRLVGIGQGVPGQLAPVPMFRTRYGEPILVRIHVGAPRRPMRGERSSLRPLRVAL